MSVAEHLAIGERADRQLVSIVGPYGELAGGFVELEHELARVELDAVLIAEHRHQQLLVQVAAIRLPIDVEPPRVAGVGAPLEHVEPQRVVGAADSHVIRHEVEQDLQPRGLERGDHRIELRCVAELRVQQVVRNDVIAVRATGPRFQDRRGIDMGDAEPLQIRSERRRGGKTELRVELQPVRGARRRHETEFTAALCRALSSAAAAASSGSSPSASTGRE